jgi:hypothetical protein
MFNRNPDGKVTQAELDGDVFIGVELSPAEKKEAARLLAEARAKSTMTAEVHATLLTTHIRARIERYLGTKE